MRDKRKKLGVGEGDGMQSAINPNNSDSSQSGNHRRDNKVNARPAGAIAHPFASLTNLTTFIAGHRKHAMAGLAFVLAAAAIIPYAAHADTATTYDAGNHASSAAQRTVTKEGTPMNNEAANEAPLPPAPVAPESTSDSTSDSTHTSSTSVTVNGQQLDVPANGSYNQTTTDSNGNTRITVNSSHSSSSDDGSGHNANININVHSSSSSESTP